MELFISHGPIFAYFGIAVFLILTGAGLPIPEEVPIVMAGVLSTATEGEPFLNPYLALASCLIGAILGDLVIYGIGRFLGKSFFRQHPKFAHLLHEEREKQMEDMIRRHGLKVFLVARFMVGVRAPIYLAAGILRVPFRRFILVDAFCATLVVSIVFWLSHRYGRAVAVMVRESQWSFTAAVIVVVFGAALIWYMRHRRSERANAAKELEDGQQSDSEHVEESRSEKNRSVA